MQCCRSLVAPSQLHVWIAKCAFDIASSVEICPCDTIRVGLIVEVQSIEVWVGTRVVPPGTSVIHSTVTATPVIVSVTSGKWHAIKAVAPCHAVPCCPYPPVLVPSNSEFVVAARISHMKVVIIGKLGMACKVSKANSQLSLHFYWCQTANLLQAQPMLSLYISKPIFIIRPSSVEVLWPVASSLKHGPPPSIVHVTPDREGLPIPWVYGVHSWPSAAQDIGLLAVKGEGVQVGTADCMCGMRRIWYT